MEKVRFALFITVFAAVGFFGVRWLTAPQVAAVGSFQKYDSNSPEVKFRNSSVSDNDATRDALRNAVLAAAADFAKDPCDTDNRLRYTKAAGDYALAWLSIAPCVVNNTCSDANGLQIVIAQKAFGTPLDHRVREAMARAHAARTVKGSDFPPETVSLLAEFAADPNLLAGQPGERLKSRFGPMAGCTG